MATKSKKAPKTKKKTTAPAKSSDKKKSLKTKLKAMNKGRVLAALVVAAIGVASSMDI